MKQEFVLKMTEAMKLEKEALMSLLPDKTMAHIDIIASELKAIIKECVFANLADRTEGWKKSTEETVKETGKTEKKARTVEIL